MYDVDYNSVRYVGHVITIIKGSPIDSGSLSLRFYGVNPFSLILTVCENLRMFPEFRMLGLTFCGISYQEYRYDADTMHICIYPIFN